MKVGDVVRFNREFDLKWERHDAIGVIVAEDAGRGWGVLWDFLDGRIGWNHSWTLEVVDG